VQSWKCKYGDLKLPVGSSGAEADKNNDVCFHMCGLMSVPLLTHHKTCLVHTYPLRMASWGWLDLQAALPFGFAGPLHNFSDIWHTVHSHSLSYIKVVGPAGMTRSCVRPTSSIRYHELGERIMGWMADWFRSLFCKYLPTLRKPVKSM